MSASFFLEVLGSQTHPNLTKINFFWLWKWSPCFLMVFTASGCPHSFSGFPSSCNNELSFFKALTVSDIPCCHISLPSSWRKFFAFEGSCDYIGPAEQSTINSLFSGLVHKTNPHGVIHVLSPSAALTWRKPPVESNKTIGWRQPGSLNHHSQGRRCLSGAFV